MKIKLKKRILLGAALSLLMVASASFAQEVKKSYKIGAAVYGLKNEYAQLWVKALKEHPAVKSGLVKLTVFDGRYDHLTQVGQFDNMITQKFDAAIYVPIDSIAGGSVVKKATEAGLPVIGSNGPVKSDQLVSFVGSNDVLGGEIEADAVIKAMGGKGNVVVLEGPVGQLGAMQRWEGNKKALDRNPDIKIIEKKTANWSRAEAMTLMQNWITANPGQINGVIAQNDEMALGAIAAIKSAGLDIKKIPVAGIDGVSDAMRSVEAGEMLLSIRQDAKTQAQGAVDVALRRLIGPSYKPMSTVWTQYPQMPWGDGTNKLYDVPWTIVMKGNAKQFIK
jgi:ABC-type sugar transport system substrate-binding protein